MRRAALAVLLAFLATASARAETFRLDWLEQHTAFGRHLVFTYRVRDLRIEDGRWQATVVVHNDSNVRVALGRNYALIAERSDGSRVTFAATTFRPRLPRVLDILGTWRGVVGGPGSPPPASLLRLRFGTMSFVILPNHRATHVTRHALPWAGRSD